MHHLKNNCCVGAHPSEPMCEGEIFRASSGRYVVVAFQMLSLTEYLYPFNEHWSNNHKTAVEIFCNTNYRSLKSWVSLSISEPVTLTEDVELKQEIVMMSPPASESGSGSPSQFSPYCVDSEPGSPLLDHEQVNAQRQDHTHSSCPFSVFCRGWWSSTMFVSTWIRVVNRLIKSVLM